MTNSYIVKLLSIAGSDPSGGAGIQADLKTFSALGAYGMAVMTALTAQNTRGVTGVHEVPAAFVKDQINDIFDDIAVHGVKIGMAGSVDVIEVIAEALERYKPPHVVLDPVMVATSGDRLLSDGAVTAMIEHLIPLADVITPNIHEAEILLGRSFNGDMESFAKDLLALGSKAVLLKGGHLGKPGEGADDVLATSDDLAQRFEGERIITASTHGTGCTLSSALAVFLAKGLSLPEAVENAKEYITGAIRHGHELGVGHGHGPVHHFYRVWE